MGELLHKAGGRTRLFDRQLGCELVKIFPGDYYVTRENVGLTTVLGSCVAACIWDQTLPAGGMNHFMLPGGGSADAAGSSARYGLYAMEVLINELTKLGAKKSNLRAKVFGGGKVLRNMTTLNVGARNSAFVLDFLQTERIQIVAQDLEDIYARKVLFLPLTGRALVKRIDPEADTDLIKSEVEYSRSLEKKPVAGDVELF